MTKHISEGLDKRADHLSKLPEGLDLLVTYVECLSNGTMNEADAREWESGVQALRAPKTVAKTSNETGE